MRGLPISREIGSLIGLVLVSCGLLSFSLRVAAATGVKLGPTAIFAGPGWLFPVAIPALVLGVWLLTPRPYRHSRLLRPEALRLRGDDPRHFKGRVEDIARLAECCRDAPLTCLVGESGTGKSVLVRQGLTRVWPAARLAVLGSSGEDWDHLPRKALAAAYGGRSEPGPDPLLLVFDQLDDYQVRFREKFLEPDNSVWKSAEAVVRDSPYWAELRNLLREGIAHVLFVTRSDASIGLDSVKLVSPHRNYQLGRLPSEDILPLVDELTSRAPTARSSRTPPWAGPTSSSA